MSAVDLVVRHFEIKEKYRIFSNSNSPEWGQLVNTAKAHSQCMAIARDPHADQIIIRALNQNSCEVARACLNITIEHQFKAYTYRLGKEGGDIGDASNCTMSVTVDKNLIGLIVGAKGSNIKGLEKKYDVKITVRNDTVEVTGAENMFENVYFCNKELQLVAKSVPYSGEDLNFIVKSGLIKDIRQEDDDSALVKNIKIECDFDNIEGGKGKKTYRKYKGHGNIVITGPVHAVDTAITKLEAALPIMKSNALTEQSSRGANDYNGSGRGGFFTPSSSAGGGNSNNSNKKPTTRLNSAPAPTAAAATAPAASKDTSSRQRPKTDAVNAKKPLDEAKQVVGPKDNTPKDNSPKEAKENGSKGKGSKDKGQPAETDAKTGKNTQSRGADFFSDPVVEGSKKGAAKAQTDAKAPAVPSETKTKTGGASNSNNANSNSNKSSQNPGKSKDSTVQKDQRASNITVVSVKKDEKQDS